MDILEYRRQYAERLRRAAEEQHEGYRAFLDKSKPAHERLRGLESAGALAGRAEVAEIQNAIDRIRSDGSAVHTCCGAVSTKPGFAVHHPQEEHRKGASITDIELEDQDGNTLTYETFFNGRPSIVVFFYTRCDNPNKCSLTITKLARLQKALVEQRLEGLLKTAAITYDPEYDLPPTLKAYGENRGVAFGDDDRIFRTRTGFRQLQEYFQLGVNITGSIVNRHRIELFILDCRGKIAVSFTRLQWDIQEVLEQAKALLNTRQSAG